MVLGGNGFIGSHLVDDLCAAGHEVRVFDRSREKYRRSIEDVEHIIGSIDDQVLLASAVKKADVVFHLISTTVPATSNENPVADVVGNLVASLRLLELAKKYEIAKLVFLSSGGTVYGIPPSVPVTESAPTRPICSHGITKLGIERYLYMYQHLYGLEYAALRVSNPYGERQGHLGVQGVIGTFINRLLRGETIEIWGDGSIERDYIYVGDVARACRVAAESRGNGIYNIGSGRSYSINQIIQAISVAANRQIEPLYKPGRAFDVPRILLDCSKAAKEIGWRPTVGLSDGIKKTWQWAADALQSPDTDI